VRAAKGPQFNLVQSVGLILDANVLLRIVQENDEERMRRRLGLTTRLEQAELDGLPVAQNMHSSLI
jgi:hypothetical protein